MPLEPSQEDFKYWAFISYSHSDDKWAEWLHQSIETFHVPKHLVGKPSREGVVPKRAFPVFRDRDELPGSANLSENIESALRLSRYLIVICSPRAVQSRWVDKEIRMFKSWGREDRVLCLVVDGEPFASERPGMAAQECLPEAVRFWVDKTGRITDVPNEPIAADARNGKDGKPNALLKLLAGILGLNFDDLKQRDIERQERRFRAALITVILILGVFSGLMVAFYLQKNRALEAQRLAEFERQGAENARERAETAFKEARAAYEKEKEAKQKEEAARQQAEASAAAERRAKEAETLARQKETEARQFAEEKRREAVEKEQTIRRTLSVSDLTASARLAEERNQAKALAYLARALRFDEENPSVIARTVSLLSQNNWALPQWSPLAHDEEVHAVEFSRDGRFLLTMSGSAAYLWDGTTGKSLTKPLKHRAKVTSAQFSPDGKFVLTTSDDDSAQLWETVSGQRYGEPLEHKNSVLVAAFSPDGKLIATGSRDKTVRLWDAATAKPLGEPMTESGPVQALLFSPDGKRLATAAVELVHLWDVPSGDVYGVPLRHEGGVYCLDFSPDGKFLATGAGDKQLRLWDAATCKQSGDVMRHESWVLTARFSPGGEQILTASSDGSARLWNTANHQLVIPPLKHENAVHSAFFSPNARSIVTASEDGTARVWDAQTGRSTSEPIRHLGPVNWAIFDPRGRRVVTASADGTVQSWMTHGGRAIVQKFFHDQQVNDAVFSPDGKRFVTIANDRTAQLWDVATGQAVLEPLLHKRAVTRAAFSPDGKLLATAAEDFSVQIWRTDTGKSVLPAPLEHGGAINQFAFSPDGQRLLTACADQRARVWEIAKGALAFETIKHDSDVRAAGYSATGNLFFTASADKTARIWNAVTGALLITIRLEAEIRSAAISTDGQWLATAADDKTVRVWETLTGKPLIDPIAQDNPVQSVVFDPVHKRILTVGEKSARVWEADTGKPVTEPIKTEEAIRSATFSADGNFILMASGKQARIWDASGKPAAEPFVHEAGVRSARFSPDNRYVLTASADQTARLWFFTISGEAPAWLGEMASAVGGYQLDNSGATELLPDSWKKISSLRDTLRKKNGADDFSVWGRWFADSRTTRSLEPFSQVKVDAYVGGLIANGTAPALTEALDLIPDQPMALAKMARLTRSLPQAEVLSGLAESYAPLNPDVLWVRTQILQRAEAWPEVWAMMERAIAMDSRAATPFASAGTAFSRGWLPKGWSDEQASSTQLVRYTRLESDLPAGTTAGLEIKILNNDRTPLPLRGPRYILKRNARCLIEGWVRSPTKSDLTIVATPFLEPGQKLKDQIIRTTPKWTPLRVQFTPNQDVAIELNVILTGGGEVQLAGIGIRSE